jgi:protein-tyrosine phosphatase
MALFLMIDLHCHILPGIDDGPQTMEESVAMARRAVEDGIVHIVATPHVNASFAVSGQSFQKNTAFFQTQVRQLHDRLKSEGLMIGIFPGAVIALPAIEEDTISVLGINNTKYLLIEFPHARLPAKAGEVVLNLRAKGYHPIVAHPERNPSIIDDPRKLMELRKIGALVQITASSLTGTGDSDVRQCAHYLVKKNAVEFIASDSHSVDTRPPVLSKAYELIAEMVGVEKAEMLVWWNQVGVINNRLWAMEGSR